MRLIMRGTRLAILLGTTRTLIHSSLYFLEKAVVSRRRSSEHGEIVGADLTIDKPYPHSHMYTRETHKRSYRQPVCPDSFTC